MLTEDVKQITAFFQRQLRLDLKFRKARKKCGSRLRGRAPVARFVFEGRGGEGRGDAMVIGAAHCLPSTTHRKLARVSMKRCGVGASGDGDVGEVQRRRRQATRGQLTRGQLAGRQAVRRWRRGGRAGGDGLGRRHGFVRPIPVGLHWNNKSPKFSNNSKLFKVIIYSPSSR